MRSIGAIVIVPSSSDRNTAQPPNQAHTLTRMLSNERLVNSKWWRLTILSILKHASVCVATQNFDHENCTCMILLIPTYFCTDSAKRPVFRQSNMPQNITEECMYLHPTWISEQIEHGCITCIGSWDHGHMVAHLEEQITIYDPAFWKVLVGNDESQPSGPHWAWEMVCCHVRVGVHCFWVVSKHLLGTATDPRSFLWHPPTSKTSLYSQMQKWQTIQSFLPTTSIVLADTYGGT